MLRSSVCRGNAAKRVALQRKAKIAKSTTKSTAKSTAKSKSKLANSTKSTKSSKSTANSTKSKIRSTVTLEDFNVTKELDKLMNATEHLDSSNAALADISIGCSANHYNLREDVLLDCANCLRLYPNGQFANYLKPTEVTVPNGGRCMVPIFIPALAGDKTAHKIALANKIFIAHQARTKKKGRFLKMPWYQPCTQSQRLCTLFGVLKKKFMWQIELLDLSEERMLLPFLKKLYDKRYKKYRLLGYASPNKRRRLTLMDRKKIDLSVFDENDPRQHYMKILFGCGAEFGFRGSAEHVFLELHHIQRGTFPPGHPWEGHEYVGFGGFSHKTKKLSVHNSYLDDNDEEFMQIPLVMDDPSNLAASILRMTKKFSRGQTRFYCKVMTEKQKRKYVEDGGDPRHEFQANVHLGKSKIKQLFDEGAEILGLENPADFYPHSLCAMFITGLANNPNVSSKELLS